MACRQFQLSRTRLAPATAPGGTLLHMTPGDEHGGQGGHSGHQSHGAPQRDPAICHLPLLRPGPTHPSPRHHTGVATWCVDFSISHQPRVGPHLRWSAGHHLHLLPLQFHLHLVLHADPLHVHLVGHLPRTLWTPS